MNEEEPWTDRAGYDEERETKLMEMGMSIVETLSQAHAVATHQATRDTPAHNMGEMKMGGGRVSAASKFIVTLITSVMLAGGVALAALYGDLSMRAGEMLEMSMPMPMP